VLDAKYFKTTLPAHAKTAGPETTVEVQLLNGQAHRVRSVLEAADGYVVLELHHRHAEMPGDKMYWAGDTKADVPPNAVRAVVSYDAIAQVVVIPSRTPLTSRIGFGSEK
jgi:hypothetical protein